MRSFYQGCVLGLGLCVVPSIWCAEKAVVNYSTQSVNQSSTVCVGYNFNLELPQFKPESTYAALNQVITGSKDDEISRVLSQGALAKLNRDNQSSKGVPPLKNTLSSSYSVYENTGITSVVIHYEGYSIPAAHPYHTVFTANYNTKTQSMVELSSLFRSDVAFLRVLSQSSREKLLAQPLSNKAMMLKGTSPVAKNFQYWALAQDGLTVFFSEAQVAPYSDGQISVTIPTEKLSGLLSDTGRQVLGVN